MATVHEKGLKTVMHWAMFGRRKLLFGIIIIILLMQMTIFSFYLNLDKDSRPFTMKHIAKPASVPIITSSALPKERNAINRDTTSSLYLKNTSNPPRRLPRRTVLSTLSLINTQSSNMNTHEYSLSPSLKRSIIRFKSLPRILSANSTNLMQAPKSTQYITKSAIKTARKNVRQNTRSSRSLPKRDVQINSHIFGKAEKTKKHERAKIVLLYTPYFGRIPWPHTGFEEGMFFQENNGSRCAKRCRITYWRRMLRVSDAVIFHANDLSSVRNIKTLRRSRTMAQRWIYLTLESPLHSPSSRALNGIFNWTSTYRRDSDVYMPYNNYQPISHSDIPEGHLSRNYAEGKYRLVAWAVAHCGAARDQIVHKLLNFIDITVFGPCSSDFNQDSKNGCPKGSEHCSDILRTFKFYLSFENSLCKDYVTEKYWETPLEHEMVPIVFGSNYDSKNAIPGSYINVWDFPSIKSLADYIKYLDNNDTAYNEYFQWKGQYKVQNHSWRCMLCDKLYNKGLGTKVYEDFVAFWSWNSNCNDQELAKKFQALVDSQ